MNLNYNVLRFGKPIQLKNAAGDVGSLSSPSKASRMWLMNLLLVLLMFAGGNAWSQVSVTATAGTAGPSPYTTLSAAFTAINAGTHQGAITVAITGNTTEPAATTALLKSAGTSSYSSILIQPSGGSWTINSAATPTASRGVIELSGADNVTIDGDDPTVGGIARNLTIMVATNTAAGTAAVRLSSNSITGTDGADNNTVKNCIIVGGRSSATSTTVSYGINMSNYSATSMTAGAYSSLNTIIDNNLIYRAYHGVYANGVSATYPNTGLQIKNNTIGSAVSADNIGLRGIFLSYTAVSTGGALVQNNDIRAGDYGATGYATTIAGIEVGTVNYGVVINRNNIHDINQPYSGGYGAHGIYITGSTNNTLSTITNNFIRDCKMVVYQTSATSTFIPTGVFFTAGATNVKFVHNTIVMNTQLGSGANYSSFCVDASVSGVTFSHFLNNILVNNAVSTTAYGFYTAATGNISAGLVNNNDYYVPSGKVGYYNAVARTTLSDWQSATGKDINSIIANPPFVSATDLHLVAGSTTTIESGGASAATTGINTDYDGDARPGPAGSVNGGATAPDMGADEFDGIAPSCLTPNALSTSGLTYTSVNLNWLAPSPAPSGGYGYEVRTSGAPGSGPAGLVTSGSTGTLTASISGLTAGTNYSAYVRSYCGGVDYSAWSPAATFFTGYCSVNGLTSSSTYYLINFKTTGAVANINNVTGAGVNGYTDYSSTISASQYAGGSVGVQMTPSTTATNYFYLWIDWNNDLDFADANETLIATTTYAATYSGSFTVPAGTPLGSYRMRIANSELGAITSCGTSPYGEYEDYTFNVVLTPTCFTPGAVTVSAVTSTGGTISWGAASPAPSNGYEYEVRSSGAPGSGATGLAVTGSTAAGVLTASLSGLTPNTNYQVYVRSFCGGTDYSGWTSGATLYTGACIPAGTVTSYWLTSVKTTNGLTNFNNVTTGSAGGYGNYYNTISASSYPGGSLTVAMTTNVGTHYFYVWVDWNNDLDFADTGETLVATTSYASAYSGSFTIPAAQALGTYRMRVANSELGAITACGPNSYGEYEDYALNVSATPTCLQPTAVTGTTNTYTTATISWTAPTPNPSNGYEYEVRTSGTAGSGSTGLVASGSTAAGITTANISGLTPETTYTIYVRSYCGGTDYSVWTSGSTFFTGYCIPTGLTSSSSYYITNVTTTGGSPNINNTTGAGTNGYANYSATTAATTYPGASVGLSISTSAGTSYYYVWVDWNNDLDFADTGETILATTTYAASYSGSFTIPAGTPLGSYRMRIGQSDIGVITACGPAGYGEYEDYTLNLVTPPPTVTSFAPTTICSAGTDAERTVVITGSVFTGATAVTVNGVAVQSYIVNSDTQITAIVNGNSGTGAIVVTGPSGTGTSANPLVINQNPIVGPITNGDAVLCIGDTADYDSATPAGTWVSSDISVATVDGNGIVTAEDAGTATISYYVTDNGCTTTVTSSVTVNTPITSSNPTAQTVVTGATATFSVTASGGITAYQWSVSTDGGDTYTPLSNTPPYSGVDTDTLTITNTPESLNENLYMVTITGETPCPAFESAGAVLNVGNVGITTQPSDVTLCNTDANDAVFTVVASGTVDGYQWQEDQGLGYVNINDGTVGSLQYSGATTSQLTVSGADVANSGWSYRAIITGPANSIPSNGAVLTVNDGIVISNNPTNQLACSSGDSSTFTVAATGTIIGYQWQYSSDNSTYTSVADATPAGVSYTGGTTSSLVVNNNTSTPLGTYYYRVVIDGAAPCGDITSDPATLSVTSPTVVVTPPAASYCLPGSAVTLTASGAASYTWAPATGLSATTGDTVTASPASTTTYTVTGTDANGCTDTQTVTVTVANGITASATATPNTVCSGGTVQLNAAGSEPFTAPPVSSYIFASSTGNALKSTAGSTQLLGSGADVAASALANIGFPFSFAGANYTQFSVSSNGAMRLGATVVTSADANNLTAFPHINPLWDDMHTCTNGSVKYVLDSTLGVGNRILVVEWNYGNYAERLGTYTKTVQVLLYEANGQIRFVFGANTGAALVSASSGIVSSATAFNSVSTATSTNSTATRNNTNTVWPAAGTAYSFTPNNAPVFTYAWTSDTSAFTSTLANPVVNPTENTTYTVTVTAASGCSATASATVLIESGAVITSNPSSVAPQCQGGTASFTVVATGPGLTYQWFMDGNPVTGNPSATTSTLTLTGTTPAMSGNYTVVVTPSCGSPVTSTAASLLVYPTPTATAPAAQTYCAGETTAAIPISGTPAGVTFDITGGAAVGLANQTGVTSVPSYTATTGNAVVTITPKANGCTGTPVTFNVIVNPLPATPTVGSNSPVCEGGTLNLTSSTVAIPGYSMNPSSGVSYIDINATGTSVGTAADDSEHNITIPAFTYNGVSYTTARVGLNGVIVFGSTTGEVTYSNVALPSTANTAGNIFLAPFWDDLDVNLGGTVKTQTVGSTFIIQWTNVDHNLFTTGGINFQVQLNLTSGAITYVYQDVIFGSATYDNGLTATVGIQLSSTSAVQYSLNSASLTNGQSITFTPNTATYSWTGPNSFSSNVQNPSIPNVTAANAGTYTVVVTNAATGCHSTASTSVTINQNYPFYVDADGDNYGTGNVVNICQANSTPPAGYSSVNGDCNDSAAAINPGHAEVLYNGVDDNCDGQLDEGNQFTTQIVASQCGTTLASIGSNISAVSKPQATAYRFEVTNTTTGLIQTIVKPVQYFNLTQLASYDYATTYSIRVELQRNGVWLGYYGSSCLVSSPAVLEPGGAAQVNPSQCGATLSSINTLIATTSLPGVTGYRFRVTNISDPSAPNQVQTIDRSLHWFSLPMLATYTYGTTYIVEVAVKTNGAYSGYGNACQISSPAVPMINNCGTIIATPTTNVTTTSLAKVTTYRFELTNLVTNMVTTVDRPTNYFTFNNVPGFSPATQYGVRVALMTSGVYSLYGDACEITSPGFARPEGPKDEAVAKLAFAAVAYPNPFAESFLIDVKTSSEAQVNIKVYDMTGRLLEVRNVEVAEMESQQIGDRYPSGVYNVIVSQGDNVKTLRVVKR